MMKVFELIEQLKQQDQDAILMVSDYQGDQSRLLEVEKVSFGPITPQISGKYVMLKSNIGKIVIS